MELWNTKTLASPPINTCKSTIKEVDLRILSKTVTEAIDFFTKQELLHKESALLSRIIYRLKTKLRSAKDMKSIEKVKKCLLNYLQMDIITTLKLFNNLIPDNYQDRKLYLPTKNLIDYILVRLQGLSKLLTRILETCKISANLIHKRILIGQFWPIAVMILGVISRLYILIKEMLKFVLNLYSTLRPYTNILKNSGNTWLPCDYVLPDDLLEWLEIDWLEIDTNVIEIPDDDEGDKNVIGDQPLMRFFNLVDDSDEDDDVVMV